MTSRSEIPFAAIFDMDGTLLNSMGFWRLVGLEYLIAHSLPLPDQNLPHLFRHSSHSTVTGILQEYQIPYEDEPLISELEQRMSKYYVTDIQPKGNVIDFLEALRMRGIPCAVATATPKEIAAEALKRHDMLKYFAFVTDGYEIGTGKSDPAFFQAVADRLGVPAQHAWMFEDAVYAVRGAKAAGMRTCAIADFTCASSEEIQCLADIYIQGYEELLPRLDEMFA